MRFSEVPKITGIYIRPENIRELEMINKLELVPEKLDLN